MLIIAVELLRKKRSAVSSCAYPVASGGCAGRIHCVSWFCGHGDFGKISGVVATSCVLPGDGTVTALTNGKQTEWGASEIPSPMKNCSYLKKGFEMDLVDFIFLDKLLKFSVKTGLLQSSILCKLFLRSTSVL